ncbi:MAG: efflux RND transporter periplasmic adaptor subunit [candidate division WOR-3 bacterium]|nr:efflux RND transporter periplasmic adaptor subunit [candidate division WOR-3 bacterium]
MSKKMKRGIIAGGIVIILVIIIVVNLKGRSAVKVQASKVQRGKIEEIVSAPGKIHAVKEVDINSDIMGKLIKLYVEEGDWVKKGQVLAKLDSIEQFAAYRRAIANVGAMNADLEFKQTQFKRKKELYKKKLISKENFENIATEVELAQLNLENAKTELKRAKRSLNKITLRSPISGTVTRVEVEEGENVIIGTMNNPGTVLLTVSNLDAMEMIGDVNESEIPLISLGDSARVSIEAFPDTQFIGTVYNVASLPKTDLTGQSGAVEFEAKIALPHHPGILPGMSATCEIITDVKKDILRITLQAVVTKKKEKGVYRIEDGKVKFTTIKTGITQGRWAEVTEGLKEEDLIVTGPLKILMKLTDNQKVTWNETKEVEKKPAPSQEIEKESRNNG